MMADWVMNACQGVGGPLHLQSPPPHHTQSSHHSLSSMSLSKIYESKGLLTHPSCFSRVKNVQQKCTY